jgi:rifampicin phosphotransferase
MLLEFFDTIPIEKAHLAGGKGGTLAKLTQLGYPVPAGFVLGAEAFDGEKITSEGWDAACQGLDQLRMGNADAFAVRSSAHSEDSAQASFAGEFETVLNVRSDDEIRAAFETVRASRHSERVQAYSQAQGLDGQHEMAVVVQQMVPSELSGVLFTVDPVSGDRTKMIGNFVEGLGEKLVSGEANAEMFELARSTGVPDGRPPGALNGTSAPSAHQRLSGYTQRLLELAIRLENDLGRPQDIEWAIANGQLYILQSRPITTLQAETEEWNDSLLGDYLWSSTNFGEALPDVMTPMTWSMMQVFFDVNRLGVETETLPMGGNIGGRMYMNLTMMASLFSALGFSRAKIVELVAEAFGDIPDGVEIPILPMTRWEAIKAFLPNGFRRFRLVNRMKKQLPAFVAETPAKTEQFKASILTAQTPAELLQLWNTLNPELQETMLMLAAGTSDYKNFSRFRRAELNRLVGEADANALLSGIQRDGSHLASLGPLVGLAKVARGEMSRADYAQQYGHRGPSEFELSIPTPSEDSQWLDRQLAEMARNPTDPTNLLAQKRTQHEEAWARFVEKYPGKAVKMRQKLEKLYEAATTREAARSEVVRMVRVFRTFALKAGELTGLGDDIFFLSLDEVVGVLQVPITSLQVPTSSQEILKNPIEKRKRTHARYASLPPYPSVIRGKFEPFEWAADPARRSDVFDATAAPRLTSNDSIRGFAGSPGVVEGNVRVLNSPSEGYLLQSGEILVANTTNVGWTPLFPRAAAIITDVGAPLSHAAIVARELGIPAVVGTGDATMRLRTGDRVRVHGGQGVVELLSNGEV